MDAYYFDSFSPPSLKEVEMARLLDLIQAEWQSDPQSIACFDQRIVDGVRAALDDYRLREAKANRELIGLVDSRQFAGANLGTVNLAERNRYAHRGYRKDLSRG
jgi:hypothetical protein